MPHYVCTGGCGAEAERPGVCQAEDCPKEGQPLVECNCEDGLHDVANASGDAKGEMNE